MFYAGVLDYYYSEYVYCLSVIVVNAAKIQEFTNHILLQLNYELVGVFAVIDRTKEATADKASVLHSDS